MTDKARLSWRQRALLVTTAVFLTVLVAIAIGEWLGWPFLATPLQHVLADTLHRDVRFSVDADLNALQAKGFQVRFVGGVRLYAPGLEIAAPAWSAAPHTLIARDIALNLRYIDLWRAHRGQPLRIDSLKAAMLDANLERLADGRATWQFGSNPTPVAVAGEPMPGPVFANLQVAVGTVRYRDAMLATDLEARLSLVDRAAVATARQAPGTVAAAMSGNTDTELQVRATGTYRTLPMKLELVSSGVLPWTTDEANAVPMPLTLNATVGRAELVFKGSATDARHLSGFTGRFSLKGPSLAAAGEPLGVTLPTTSAFRSDGAIVRRADTWYVVIDEATVGASRLQGAFTYEAGRSVPLLSGRLGGTRLLLTDLGPAVGVTPGGTGRGKGLVLPDRPFDLASLRRMEANVWLDFGELDLSSRLLEPLRPMRGHLQLAAGVLTLNNFDARMGEGRLKGDLALDGRQSTAVWNANLRWDGVQLERWIHQARAAGAPPFVSGRLNGKTNLQGQGRSTAEILATLKGQFRAELKDGAVSHLVIEAAGLDLAESLGVLLTGDKPLPVQCGVADLVAESGVFRPRVMVLDTTDSAVWIDGSLSLASEALDLKAVVTPKDFSPLTLRAPLLVRGTFANPKVSIEKGPLGRKLASSFLLALLNPLAALIPLIDRGDAAAANAGAAACEGLMQRSNAQRTAAARVR